MGRAYEVRKASIQKTGAAKAKLYSMYAKEIYQAAKNGGTEVTSNANLKRLIERAKKEYDLNIGESVKEKARLITYAVINNEVPYVFGTNKALAKYNKYIDYINEEIFRI